MLSDHFTPCHPPSFRSYHTGAVSSLLFEGCTAKEKNPALILKTLPWQSLLCATANPLPCSFLLRDGFWKQGFVLNDSGLRGLVFPHVGISLDLQMIPTGYKRGPSLRSSWFAGSLMAALLTCVGISIKTPESCACVKLWDHSWSIYTHVVEFSDLSSQLDT